MDAIAGLVSLNHQREGQRDRFAAKLDDPKADRWVSSEEAKAQLDIEDRPLSVGRLRVDL